MCILADYYGGGESIPTSMFLCCLSLWFFAPRSQQGTGKILHRLPTDYKHPSATNEAWIARTEFCFELTLNRGRKEFLERTLLRTKITGPGRFPLAPTSAVVHTSAAVTTTTNNKHVLTFLFIVFSFRSFISSCSIIYASSSYNILHSLASC
jgi:hypothetical protein